MADCDTEVKAVWDGLHSGTDHNSTWWQKIKEHYGEEQRHYHTLKHIQHMLSLWKQHKHVFVGNEGDHVALAIFFHDVIYDPKAPDNEEKSAELFEEYAGSVGMQEGDKSRISDWILATKAHSTDAHRTEGAYGRDPLHYLLDMDMAILGTHRTAYTEYADQIRSEYIHVPILDYCHRRAQVLETFLKTVNIYATPEFRSTYESVARENLSWEIKKLKRQAEELSSSQ